MKSALDSVFDWALRWSRTGVIGTLTLLFLLHMTLGDIGVSTQLAIALLALLVGIPHGAIDHLISIPSKPRSRFIAYIVIYVAIAILAGWAIATWNINGFCAVLLMSALHFGFGDASYLNERRDSKNQTRISVFLGAIYAIPAGFLPVILPLTDSRTQSALERINPALNGWAGDYGTNLRNLVMAVAVVAVLALLLQKRFEMVIDLALLFALSYFAPPLIAFACYFGFWHALRHTARLVPKLPAANSMAIDGNRNRAISNAVFPGLYAVGATLLAALVAMIWFPEEFSYSLLWSTLVIVWALTVPHMISTARFDRRALSVK